MSQPLVYKYVFIIVGCLFAVLLPLQAAELALQISGSVVLGGVAALATIYILMSVTAAALSIGEYIPEELPMGPSFAIGFGMLFLGFWIIPTIFLPGLAWLYFLPVDEQGRFNKTHVLNFDFNHITEPIHD